MAFVQVLQGNASGAVKAIGDLNKAINQSEKEFKEATKEANKLKGAARSVAEQADPQKRYNRQVQQLAGFVRDGKVQLSDAEIVARKYGDRLNRAGQSGRRAFGSAALSQIRNYALGIASISGSVALIKSEIQGVIDLGDKITTRQQSAAVSNRALRQQISSLPEAEQKKILSGSKRIASSLSISQDIVNRTISSAFSSVGAERVLEFTETGLRFTRGDPGSEETIGAIGDVANALGPGTSAIQALGALGVAAQQSRVATIPQAAKNLPKVLTGIIQAGGTAAQGAALFAGITSGASDTTGEVSRTAILNLTGKLDEFFAKNIPTGLKVTDVDEVSEQLPLLLNDVKLAGKFIRSNTFEAAAKPGVESLFLEPGSRAREAFNAALSGIRSPEQQIAAGDRAISTVNAGALSRTEQTQAALASSVEGLQLLVESDSLSKESRLNLQDIRQQLGGSRTVAKLGNLLDSGLITNRSEAIDILSELVEALRSGQSRVVIPSPVPILPVDTPGPVTDLAVKQADLLQQTVEILTKIQVEGTGGNTLGNGREE